MSKSARALVSTSVIAWFFAAACSDSNSGAAAETTPKVGSPAGGGAAGGVTASSGAGTAGLTAGMTGANGGGAGAPAAGTAGALSAAGGAGVTLGAGGARTAATGGAQAGNAGAFAGGAGPGTGGSTADAGLAGVGPLEPLISADWTLAPGTESYTCARKTIADDLFVDGFAATIPVGTHHTLLTMGAPDKADGVIPCSVFENRTQSIFSSGVGTKPLSFPPGIALKIAKGSQLLLNLHLFNTSTDPISGTSGTSVHVVDAKDVKYIAEEQLAGTLAITLPPHTKTTTIGGCLASSDVTIFAVAPHMHKLGVYLKAIGQSSVEGDRVLIDGPYDFDNQSFSIIKPLQMKKGDNVRVECTHDNTTDNTVTFGESTLSEMCFAGLYRYPADGTNFICTTGPTQ